MIIKEKDGPRWVLVGKMLNDCADRGFEEPLSRGSAFLKLVELDSRLPIIRHKNKKQITRVQIYESLWNEISSKFISYFYNDNENQKLLREYIYTNFPSYPTSPYVYSKSNFFIYVMNTEHVLAAITEILAYSCSEKKIAHRTSKSKDTTKSHYIKDQTYIELLNIRSMYENGNLTANFLHDLHFTEYAEMFIPNIFQKTEELHSLFTQNQPEVFFDRLKIIIKELEFITERDDLLRERVTNGADSELRLYLSDNALTSEVEFSSSKLLDPGYIQYRKTTGMKMKKIIKSFEQKHPFFKIERMAFIRNAISDLNNALKTSPDEKPIRGYREISKHIREYRNSLCIYTFGKPYSPRKR